MSKYQGEKFKIPYPESKAGKKQWAKEYGLNAYYAGKHWSKRKNDAEFWHRLTRCCMDQQGVRLVPFKRPVIITFRFNDVIKLITLISVSCLHFGQKRGKFFRIVSSRIFNRVLLEQTGQRIHSFVSNKALPPKLHAMQSVV